MEEKEKIKKMTPLEFVYYLEGYFMVIGNRGLTSAESSKIIEMLKNVEKQPNEQPPFIPTKPIYDYVPNREETTAPDPDVYQYRDTSVPDPNFCKPTENICYCYTENKKGE